MKSTRISLVALLALLSLSVRSQSVPEEEVAVIECVTEDSISIPDSVGAVSAVLTEEDLSARITAAGEFPQPDFSLTNLNPYKPRPSRLSIYELPYSMTGRQPNWRRLWLNTGVLVGAYVTTLVVLECLPEDATNWNRAEIQTVPLFKRWYEHVIKEGPEWDGDSPIFNYLLHPYAGAVYFMSARSCGFNFWQSFLYSALISTVGWEYGIEAFMERPSIQDLFITPVIGSIIGELFYKLKRNIVSHDYTLAGSRILGNAVVFLIDPVNEVIGLFAGNEARKLHLGREHKPAVESSLMPAIVNGAPGFSFTCRF